jgi:hypothetical protein
MTAPDNISRLTEKLEVLDGSRRGGDKSKSAVRVEDVKELLLLIEVKTKTLTAAPTMANFNDLLDDVREISTRLTAIAKAIQKKQLP